MRRRQVRLRREKSLPRVRSEEIVSVIVVRVVIPNAQGAFWPLPRLATGPAIRPRATALRNAGRNRQIGPLEFCAHAADHVVHRYGSDGMFFGIDDGEAAQIVFVKQLENFLVFRFRQDRKMRLEDQF